MFHPSYHELMALGLRSGCSAFAWRHENARPGLLEAVDALRQRHVHLLGPPVPFSPLFGGRFGSPTKNRLQKKGYPYSNLSTGGHSLNTIYCQFSIVVWLSMVGVLAIFRASTEAEVKIGWSRWVLARFLSKGHLYIHTSHNLFDRPAAHVLYLNILLNSLIC